MHNYNHILCSFYNKSFLLYDIKLFTTCTTSQEIYEQCARYSKRYVHVVTMYMYLVRNTTVVIYTCLYVTHPVCSSAGPEPQSHASSPPGRRVGNRTACSALQGWRHTLHDTAGLSCSPGPAGIT